MIILCISHIFKIVLQNALFSSLLGCLSFTVQMQSLTLEGCFHIHLLKVESFSELIKKLEFKGRAYE